MSAGVRAEPFPHSSCPAALPSDLADGLLDWFESAAPWRLRVESFYEQWELHLDASLLPPELRAATSADTVGDLRDRLLGPLVGEAPRLTEVTAHRLMPGQTIRIHNDYLGGGETHRILVQLNRGWRDEQGGLLMLFAGPRPEDVARVVRPIHRSAFGFSIGPGSYHAVSTIRSGERFTVVYSFAG